jgi:hypothetical protein
MQALHKLLVLRVIPDARFVTDDFSGAIAYIGAPASSGAPGVFGRIIEE